MVTVPRPVRHRCELAAKLELGAAAPLQVRVLELSETGGFVEETAGMEELQVGDRARLSIAMPGSPVWSAKVVVSRAGTSRREVRHPSVEHVTVTATGFGVEFEGMSDDDLEQLRGFLELLDER